jgi:hypothetical protein
MKVTGLYWDEKKLVLRADVLSVQTSSLTMRSPWQVLEVQGALFEMIGQDLYRLSIGGSGQGSPPGCYEHRTVVVSFAANR